jgi:hypothetical protein
MLSWSKERKGDSAAGDLSQNMDFVENTKNKHFKLLIKYQNKRKSTAAHSPADDIAAA